MTGAMSAFGGEADIMFHGLNSAYDPTDIEEPILL